MPMKKTLCIAISSRALFDLEEGHKIYVEKGIEAYCEYQLKHENELLKPGIGFSLVKKLLALNENPKENRDFENLKLLELKSFYYLEIIPIPA